MKNKILITVAAGMLATASQAKDIHSPDGQFAIRAEATISLVDSRGNEILMLERDTQGDQKVEVAWSPDSRHVVIVENGIRDSAITAAWKDQVWHKTIEVDHASIRKEGRLIAEHRKLSGWLTPSEVAVDGEMTFSTGTKYHYTYTLAFRQVPGRLDRGGYEEGQLIGKDYHGL
jgi:hypothetical protein